MEEIKRSEYFKSLITGTVYKKKIQIPIRKSQQEKEEEVQDKFLKEISDRFYHRGRSNFTIKPYLILSLQALTVHQELGEQEG
jgi:hypothetical protein